MKERLIKNWQTSAIGAVALLAALGDLFSRPEMAAILERLRNMSDLRFIVLAVLFAVFALRSKD